MLSPRCTAIAVQAGRRGHAHPGQRLLCGCRVRARLHPRHARGAAACLRVCPERGRCGGCSSNLDDLLPAVQLGVTLCSLALGWLGEPLAAQILAGWMGALPRCADLRARGSGRRRLCADHLLSRRGRRAGAQIAWRCAGPKRWRWPLRRRCWFLWP